MFPGIAALVGLTLPTGVPVETASNVLATDATGTGAFQVNGGIALEQPFRAWTTSIAGLVAKRRSRNVQGVEDTLGTQWTLLVAGAYTFGNEVAIAASASFTGEGDATINGVEQQNTSRRLVNLTASAVYPFSDSVRMQGAVFVNPPVSSLGLNQNSMAGVSLMVIYAWM